MTIIGNSNEFYDMIVRFHDAVYKNSVKNVLFKIKILPEVNDCLFQDFLSLVNDIVVDFGVDVKFEVINNVAG